MKSYRVLITGGTGLLGKTLLETAPAGWEVFATYYRNRPPLEWSARFYPLDVRDEHSISSLFDALRPEVVIHTASIGSVDEAERNPFPVHQVNVGGTKSIAGACGRRGAFLVHLSTNAVFDGKNPPYAEESPLVAANRYGALKIEAEDWVRRSGAPVLIIRPILMYGWPLPGGRDNVVVRWLTCLEKGETVEVTEAIFSMPLWAADCAEVIWRALEGKKTGTYHVAGADRISLATFAKITARVFSCAERLVVPVPNSRFSVLAPRPMDTSFVTTKMERELGVRPLGVVAGLTRMQRTRSLVA